VKGNHKTTYYHSEYNQKGKRMYDCGHLSVKPYKLKYINSKLSSQDQVQAFSCLFFLKLIWFNIFSLKISLKYKRKVDNFQPDSWRRATLMAFFL